MDKSTGAPIKILLVEDNPGDVRLTVELFKECKIRNGMSVVNDGIEAMEYLRHAGSMLIGTSGLDTSRPLPSTEGWSGGSKER